MSDAAVACPLGEANLAHDSRLDRVVAAPAGRAARERRGRPLERTELLADRLECPLVEPRADLGDVDQLALVVETQVQRAEMRPRALWHRVAADHELLPELTLDLQPVPRAFRGIGAVALLRDHAFQPLLAGGGEKVRAVLQHVVTEVDDAARWHQEPQALLARLERQPTEIAAVENQRVEEDGADRHDAPRALDVGRARQAHALLEPLEARAPALVERHDLAVQDEARERQRVQRRRHFGITGRDDLAAATAQLDLVTGARGEDADAVVLDLEEPRRVRRRLVDERREHQQIALRRDLAARRLELGQAPTQRLDPTRAVAQLFDRQPREHRFGIALGRLRLAGVFVGLLQEEPVPVLAAHPGQGPSPLQLVAEQLELELAARDLLAGRLWFQKLEPAGVPHDRRPGPIAALGNDAFEVGVLDGMVFDVHGQTLLVRAHRGPLGHGPALQHAVDLQPQIVVEPARRVLVDHEPAAAGRAGPAEGLGGRGRIALAPVLLEGAASHAAPGSPRARPSSCPPRAPPWRAAGFPSARTTTPTGARSRKRPRNRARRSRERRRRWPRSA